MVPGPLDEVPDDEEVTAVTHALDHAQLILGALERLGRHRVAEAPGKALHHELSQILGLDHPARTVEAWNQLLAELDLDIAALCHLQGRSQRLRPARKLLHHLVGGTQVELVGVKGQLWRLERRLRLHAEQRRVVVIVLTAQVVHVTGADQRPAELPRDPLDPKVRLVLSGDAVVLNLEVHVLRPIDLDQLVGDRPRLVLAVGHQRLAEARGETASEGDNPLRVLGHQLRVDRRLAALQTLQKAR